MSSHTIQQTYPPLGLPKDLWKTEICPYFDKTTFQNIRLVDKTWKSNVDDILNSYWENLKNNSKCVKLHTSPGYEDFIFYPCDQIEKLDMNTKNSSLALLNKLDEMFFSTRQFSGIIARGSSTGNLTQLSYTPPRN